MRRRLCEITQQMNPSSKRNRSSRVRWLIRVPILVSALLLTRRNRWATKKRNC